MTAGGPGGFDMASLMAQMGQGGAGGAGAGAGGEGGASNIDFEALMKQVCRCIGSFGPRSLTISTLQMGQDKGGMPDFGGDDEDEEADAAPAESK